MESIGAFMTMTVEAVLAFRVKWSIILDDTRVRITASG